MIFVLAYPTLTSAEFAWIDAYRAALDKEARDLVKPHFTLVFGLPDGLEAEICAHVQKVAATVKPISFECRYAMLGQDHESPRGHVFLVPDQGLSAIARCHDALYAEQFRAHKRLDLMYVPHITIGTLPTLEAAKAACDRLNALDLNALAADEEGTPAPSQDSPGVAVKGMLQKLTVVRRKGGAVEPINDYPLGG